MIRHSNPIRERLWRIQKHHILWKAWRRTYRRYEDRNAEELLLLMGSDLREFVERLRSVLVHEVLVGKYGGGDIFCSAMQLDKSCCACINDH